MTSRAYVRTEAGARAAPSLLAQVGGPNSVPLRYKSDEALGGPRAVGPARWPLWRRGRSREGSGPGPREPQRVPPRRAGDALGSARRPACLVPAPIRRPPAPSRPSSPMTTARLAAVLLCSLLPSRPTRIGPTIPRRRRTMPTPPRARRGSSPRRSRQRCVREIMRLGRIGTGLPLSGTWKTSPASWAFRAH